MITPYCSRPGTLLCQTLHATPCNYSVTLHRMTIWMRQKVPDACSNVCEHNELRASLEMGLEHLLMQPPVSTRQSI